MKISKVLRSLEDNGLMFYCPGCESHHAIYYGNGVPPRWDYDGNKDYPTFSPSIKVTYPANPDASDEFSEWRKERVCHSFITAGKIKFLNDCTHKLKGQTADLPEIDPLREIE